jgi:hypothetical protein
MSSLERLDLATRLAYALLRQAGSLSLGEIEALPAVLTRQEALGVANRLLQSPEGDVEESPAARAGAVTRDDHLICLKAARRGALTA